MLSHIKNITKAAFCAVVLFAGTPSAHGAIVDRIVAVVNDDIITAQELQDRLAFAAKNIQEPLSATQKQALINAQLSELIEEELLLQYADEKGYSVTSEQIDQTIANIERENKRASGSFLAFAGDQRDSALRSIKTSILTQMITQRELQQLANVSDREVARVVDGIISRQDENAEKELAQIFLPVDESSEEGDVKKTIERLYTQLTKEKASFDSLARAYSRDRSATAGGVLGWFRMGELVPAIENAVDGLGKGEVSPPTRSSNGWHIFKVLDERVPDMPNLEEVTELRLIQLYAPIDSTLGTPARLQNQRRAEMFEALAEDLETQQQFEEMVEAQKEKSPLYIASGDMGWVSTEGLAKDLRSALQNTQANQIVGPVTNESGTYLFYVADRREQTSPALEKIRGRVKQRLISRQTDLEFRRLIRDLRRRAFIENRL